MKKLTPVGQAKLLEDEYRNYVKSTFTLDDEEYYEKFKKELGEVELVKGPFLNKILPFRTGDSIKKLCEDGTLNKGFKDLKSLSLERTLYKHQIEALNKISNGRSIVVTTGTGSGKTESYLFPILNYIMNSNDIDKPGVRALFLFPMNALVNDQMKRIRELLSAFPKIKFGRYVGDTKDHINPNVERNRLGKVYNCKIPDNELVTREEIRDNPPHLLFTNFSMLEYLLLRPKDSDLLAPKNTTMWQFIVLDEAHTYNGALGIEVSMLLRRLIEKIQRKPQFILTSATLGDQGKSENEIIQFAQSLTSIDYHADDIIFASRKPVEFDVKYTISGEDYSLIKDNLDKQDEINKIISKYIDVNVENNNELLLKLLKGDNNVEQLNNILVRPELFKTAFNHFNGVLTEQQLSDMIFLISYVFTNTKELFDIKYHTFIRTIDGCFVTLNEEKNLSLKRCLEINDHKAFELGKCKKCGNTYIIGKIEGGYLRQNTDIDIYENVEEGITVPVEYFIFNDDISEFDPEPLERFKLCTKCGKIYSGDETHPDECSCDNKYIRDIYKVHKDDSKDKSKSNILYNNNITYCPCCQKSSNSGIVSAFYLGKDASTAVITQIMLKAIDKEEDTLVTKKSSNPFEIVHEIKAKPKYAKQLLEFSDARQQASFASTFCSYNHERFLRKKLLFDTCKDANTPIAFDVVKTRLENRIRDNNLFDNEYAKNPENGPFKNAWITILNELLKIDGENGAEGLGLFAFQMDFSPIKENEEFIRAYFENKGIELKLTNDELYSVLSIIINFFRGIPAIEYNDSTLSYAEKKEEFSYRMFDNYVMVKKDAGSHVFDSSGTDITQRVRSLLPAHDSKSNKLIDYVMVVNNYDMDQAKKFVVACFEMLVATNRIVSSNNISSDSENTSIDYFYKVPADRFNLIGPKAANWHYCTKCKSITLYDVNHICPNCANKNLESCDPNEIFKDNYYRKEYMNKKVERLVFREHTGQLQAEEATRVQQEFQDKKINMLSCSTTFEMGVDIGTLETVFMRNVPPTPANYVQRAGRAGRGKDSSAFVLTFCGPTSHDYTYFCEPEKMISGKIVPPIFNIANKKIALRHIIDTALSFHLKYHKDDFNNIGAFMKNFDLFKNYINSKSDNELNTAVNNFISTINIPEYFDWGWINEAIGDQGILTGFADDFRAYISEMERLSEDAYLRGDSEQGSYYKEEKRKMEERQFIDSLALKNVIPRYGFPIDTVQLSTPSEKANIALQRDLRIALSEYAPDSEVIARGVKYTSRYVILPKRGEVTKYYYYMCPSCGRINYNVNSNMLSCCSICNQPNENRDRYFIVPEKGFKSDTNTTVSKTIKPKKSFSNDIQYLGNGTLNTEVRYNDQITLISSKDDELIVLNENPFYMCHKCGYTIIDKDEALKKSTSIKKEHSNGYEKCKCEDLQTVSLGYTFRTDVLKLKFNVYYSLSEVVSFMYALLDGISEAFTIQRNDINGVISQEPNTTYSVILYDDVPGGAGHVKRLLDLNLFKNAMELALRKVNNCTCDLKTACHNCLRNYKNQRYHKYLVRGNAIKVLANLLKS